jgi:Mn2+/Fe2+ NRAMP family transporter
VVPILAAGAIFVGCAAYQAGNILGGVAGIRLAAPLPQAAVTAVCGLAVAALLWWGTPRALAHLLSLAVAVMGVAFLVTAASLAPDAGALLRGALVPATPAGAGFLVLGLLGTTVVPYNLFLGSALAGGEGLSLMRFGVAVAVGLGGLISMGVLVAGTAVAGELTFPALAAVLAERLGPWASGLFAAGLAAAGLSSALTAPLAAALTARAALGEPGDARWGPRGWRYRAVWGAVLATGVGCGLAGVQPIPVILLAQAANGLRLPLAALFLLAAVNDRRLMGGAVNGAASNAAMGVVVAVTVLLGLLQIARAAAGAFALPLPSEGQLLAAALVVTVLAAWPVASRMARRRRLAPPGGR